MVRENTGLIWCVLNESVPLILQHPTPPVHSLHLSSHPQLHKNRKIDLSNFSVSKCVRGSSRIIPALRERDDLGDCLHRYFMLSYTV